MYSVRLARNLLLLNEAPVGLIYQSVNTFGSLPKVWIVLTHLLLNVVLKFLASTDTLWLRVAFSNQI